jgi:protein TonB
MEATVPGGGVAVPTAPRSRSRAGSVDGGEKGDQTSGGPVPIAELTELPRLLAQPSQSAMRAVYPEAARRDGTEADVQLRLLVGRNGRVSQVRILRRAGKGFDRVAVRLVKRFRFRPGRRGGQPVPVWIPWTYKFRLAE